MRFSIIMGLLFFTAVPLQASLAPHVYERQQELAPYHLRIEIVESSGGFFGECTIEGTIVKVLRAPEGGLVVGDRVKSDIYCVRPMPIMPGPIIRIHQDALQEGNIIEGYFEPTRGARGALRPAAHGSGTRVIKNRD